MSKKTPILYNALLLTAVNLLLRMVSTSFQVFLSGRIGAAGIGLLQLVLSVAGMSMTVASAGIRTATMYLTAAQLGRNRPERIRYILFCCIRYSLLCSCAVAAGVYLFAPLIASEWIGNTDCTQALRIACCFLPVSCLCGVMTGYFTAANKIGTLAAVEVAEQLVTMAVTMVLLFVWAEQDIGKACQCVVLGSGAGAAVTLLLLTLLRLLQHAPMAPPFPVKNELLSVAVPLALADDLKTGINTAENLMVPQRLKLYPSSFDPLAVFGTVCGMVFPLLMFPAAIVYALADLLIPEMARCHAAGDRERIQHLAVKSLRTVLLYGCICCGVLYLLAQPLCHWLYQSPAAAHQLHRYALLAPMLYTDSIIDAMNKGLGQQRRSVRYNILTAAMDIGLLFILLPRSGMDGYFFSFLITHLINLLLSLRLLLKTAGISFWFGKELAAAAVSYLVMGCCKGLLGPWTGVCTYCIAFLSVLRFLELLPSKKHTGIKTALS